MRDVISFREYQEEDRATIERMISDTWHYERFCSPQVASRIANTYLNGCLANQSYTQVALLNGEVVGIIMAKNKLTHKCPLSIRLKFYLSLLRLYSTREGRKSSKIFERVEQIDAQLLAQTKTNYQAELTFFAVSEKSRGKGIGKALLTKTLDYLREQRLENFYLFSDTSCNYGFYEHNGMQRKQEHQEDFSALGIEGNETFFLYDYNFKEAGAKAAKKAREAE